MPPADVPLCDVLKIMDGDVVTHIVTHGHQFDDACMQHGDIPWAKSAGEVHTECLGWTTQGGEIFWKQSDTRRWYNGTFYPNVLAVSTALPYPGPLYLSDLAGFLANDPVLMEVASRALVETLLTLQVGWEYFESTTGGNSDNGMADGFIAFCNEIWTGDEMAKLKHLDEVALCGQYQLEFKNVPDKNRDQFLPTLIIGHTHEPRHIFANPENDHSASARPLYMNTGSAGRHDNLIWCVEIDEHGDRVVSWSNIAGWLTRIVWKPSGNQIVHDSVTRVTYVGGT